MRTMLHAFADKRCDVLWDALPKSYQRDVEDLVRTFAARMDREVWDGVVAAGRGVVAVLEAQRDRILKHQLAASVARDLDGERYDLVVGMLGRLLDSDAAKLDRLAKADMPALLRSTGAIVLQWVEFATEACDRDRLARLREVQIEVLTEADDHATVRLTIAGEVEKVKMARVEGRWVPAEMAEEWQREVKRLRKKVEKIEIDADTAARVKTVLPLVMVSLRQLEDAASDQEFELALQTMMLNLQNANRRPRPAKAPKDRTAPQPGR